MTPLISKTLLTPITTLHLLRFSTRSSSAILFLLTHFRPMSSDSARRVFQLKVDPLTGNSEWIVIEDETDESSSSFNTSSPALLATTSYLDMLNDSARNRAYRQAIDKTVTKSCHVLDIGAGTGLLSMMAVRAMSGGDGRGMVTACESYLPMVKLMRKVLNANGMGRNIRMINKRSDELQVGVDIPSRADVLVSEILDSEFLGEGLIPTLQHAHDMLLVDNPLTVPYRATTYGQLVESSFLWKLHDLYNNEAEATDEICLVPNGLNSILRIKQQQHPMHCDAISKEIKLLSDPFKVFEFDFWRRPDSHHETKFFIKAIGDGTVHAVVSWWTLQLDREGTIFYSTAPKWIDVPMNISAGNWCDHWKQCVWFVPGKGIPISKDEDVPFHAVHTNTSILYNLSTQRTEIRQHDSSDVNFHLTLPPERMAIYGDNKWRSSMLAALKNALQARVHHLCVVADDSIYLTLLVLHLSKSHVISLFPGLRDGGAQYIQAVAKANGFVANRVEVLKNRCLTLQDTHQKKVDLLIAEPYYFGNEGMLPWQNLRFWKERTMLDSVLSKDVLIMPCKAILKACAMSLPDLWSSRRCLSKIEGFDHSIVNTTFGACGELPMSQEAPILPFFIWQCGDIKVLSETFTVMEFEFSKPISSCHGVAQVEFTQSGTCHGFALWLDWVMDAENSIILSTGPDQRYWKQGVKLLAKPVVVGIRGSSRDECCCAVIEASFDPSRSELCIKPAFS